MKLQQQQMLLLFQLLSLGYVAPASAAASTGERGGIDSASAICPACLAEKERGELRGADLGVIANFCLGRGRAAHLGDNYLLVMNRFGVGTIRICSTFA